MPVVAKCLYASYFSKATTTLMKTFLKTLGSNCLDLLYPAVCAGCSNPLITTRYPVCDECMRSLPITGFEQTSDNLVNDIFKGRIHLERADALLFFARSGIVQHIIHGIKYRNRRELGIFMGEWMGKRLQNAAGYPLPDAIIPLPLNSKKLKQRGYNQSELLAEGLANVLKIPVLPVAVMRTQYTSSQTRKSRIARWLNVAEVFDLDKPENLAGKSLMLVDDVITTGATMEACGEQLLRIPGARLSLLSLAFARTL